MRRKLIYLITAVSVVALIVMIAMGKTRMGWRHACVERSKVVTIIAVSYRDSTFINEHGKQVTINQGTYKVGDSLCTRTG